MDLHNLGGKLINMCAADSAVVKKKPGKFSPIAHSLREKALLFYRWKAYTAKVWFTEASTDQMPITPNARNTLGTSNLFHPSYPTQIPRGIRRYDYFWKSELKWGDISSPFLLGFAGYKLKNWVGSYSPGAGVEQSMKNWEGEKLRTGKFFPAVPALFQ